MTEARYWMGPAPAHCDMCKAPIDKMFFDMRTTMGPWGNGCSGCFHKYGVGLGTGMGQRYELQTDGRFMKTGG